jgi:hypothetical protein
MPLTAWVRPARRAVWAAASQQVAGQVGRRWCLSLSRFQAGRISPGPCTSRTRPGVGSTHPLPPPCSVTGLASLPVSRHSPDDSQLGANNRVFQDFFEAKHEIRAHRGTTDGPSDGQGRSGSWGPLKAGGPVPHRPCAQGLEKLLQEFGRRLVVTTYKVAPRVLLSDIRHRPTADRPRLGCARRQVHPSERSVCRQCGTVDGSFVSMGPSAQFRERGHAASSSRATLPLCSHRNASPFWIILLLVSGRADHGSRVGSRRGPGFE